GPPPRAPSFAADRSGRSALDGDRPRHLRVDGTDELVLTRLAESGGELLTQAERAGGDNTLRGGPGAGKGALVDDRHFLTYANGERFAEGEAGDRDGGIAGLRGGGGRNGRGRILTSSRTSGDEDEDEHGGEDPSLHRRSVRMGRPIGSQASVGPASAYSMAASSAIVRPSSRATRSSPLNSSRRSRSTPSTATRAMPTMSAPDRLRRASTTPTSRKHRRRSPRARATPASW